jgi:NDP-sugar pyrophosphorylase family protein
MISYLRDQGVANVVLCTGYGAKEVADYSGDGSRWGVRVAHSVEKEPLGTGGAIKHAEVLIESDPFLVFNGDSLVRVNLADLLRLHRTKEARITLVVTHVPDQTRFGSAMLARDSSILGFSEKGQRGPGVISAGIYLMNRSILEAIPPGCRVSLERDLLPAFAGLGMYGMPVTGPLLDLGTPEAYENAQRVIIHWPEAGV